MAAKQAEEHRRGWAHSWVWSQSRLRVVSHVDLSNLINTGKLKTGCIVATTALAVARVVAMAVAAIAVPRPAAAGAFGTAVVLAVLVSIVRVVVLGLLVLAAVVVVFFDNCSIFLIIVLQCNASGNAS